MLSLLIGTTANIGFAETSKPKWKPTITEEKKEEIQPFILYFMDAETAEMDGDEDFSQAFPWRSFRATIEALKTAEAASWIIETIPKWVDGPDQESLAMLCQKATDLATPNELEELITILKNKETPEAGRYWGLFILEKTSKEENLNYLQNNIQGILADKISKDNLEIAKAIAVALRKDKSNEKNIDTDINIDVLNSILEALESSNTQKETESKS